VYKIPAQCAPIGVRTAAPISLNEAALVPAVRWMPPTAPLAGFGSGETSVFGAIDKALSGPISVDVLVQDRTQAAPPRGVPR
jgi:hypothetical protein